MHIVFLDRDTLPARPLSFNFPHTLHEFPATAPEQTNAHLAGAQIAITNKVAIRAEHLAANPQLKLIAVAATGYDHIDLATRLGYKASSTWAYAAELNFKSQFNKGYSKYPVTNDAAYISKFMAPGYLLGSIGMTYTHPREDLKVLISPVSEKMTFVSDRRLSDEGAYGVEKGDRVLAEFGALVKGTYSKKITENVLFNTEVLLTSAYKTFGNVDVDWKMSLDWKLNKYFTFKANTYLLYDDDIRYVDKDGVKHGPRVQFKEVVGLGLGYIF